MIAESHQNCIIFCNLFH